MIRVSVRSDYMRYGLELEKAQRWILPYAAAAALNDCAKGARQAIQSDLPQIFDRPTPFTKNGMFVRTADAHNLTSTLGMKPIQAGYLSLQETGGERTAAMAPKGRGKALIVPSGALKLNRYGNIPKGAVAKLYQMAQAGILDPVAKADQSRFQTEKQLRRKQLVDQTRAKRDTGYFVLNFHGPGNQGPGGIFKRVPGHSYLRLITFASNETFHQRFQFHMRAARFGHQNFRKFMGARLLEQKVRRGWGKG